MRIGELAKATGLSTSRVRFYEKQGILPPADRRTNGYRDYPASTVAVLRFIDQGQALGFTLAELGGALAAGDEQMPARADMIAGLRRKHAELESHIRIAVARQAQIGELIAELTSCDDPADDDVRPERPGPEQPGPAPRFP